MLKRCQTPALLKVTKHKHGHVALTRLQIKVYCQSDTLHTYKLVKRHWQPTVPSQSAAMAPAMKLECSGFVEIVSGS